MAHCDVCKLYLQLYASLVRKTSNSRNMMLVKSWLFRKKRMEKVWLRILLQGNVSVASRFFFIDFLFCFILSTVCQLLYFFMHYIFLFFVFCIATLLHLLFNVSLKIRFMKFPVKCNENYAQDVELNCIWIIFSEKTHIENIKHLWDIKNELQETNFGTSK